MLLNANVVVAGIYLATFKKQNKRFGASRNLDFTPMLTQFIVAVVLYNLETVYCVIISHHVNTFYCVIARREILEKS